MGGISRRQFLSRSGKRIAGAALGGLALNARSHGRTQGANEHVKLALIGCGGRGRSLINGLIGHGAEVLYVCDVNRTRFAGAVHDVESGRLAFDDARETPDMQAITSAPWHRPARFC